ncbi:acyltransferase family protein [Mycolicibacterium sp. Dal123E01]|uniref:acyltransferase family protein n=1 Tax=Mycolicibacterium sp. Dal123E01 TaxID=3457578 RepID=UPI00403EB27F
MTLGFPTPAEIAAQTSPNRDRAIDVIRNGSLLGVVLGHTVMATSIIADGVLHWDNLLTTSSAFQAATWIFQIMPLFFFAGAAASMASWRADANWGQWLMRRCTRLFRPVFYYLTFWAVALTVLRHVLPPHVHDPVAGVSTQLLWFLGAYVLMLAAMPLLARITTTHRLVIGIAAIYLAVAAVDAVRLTVPGSQALGYVNLMAWLIPGMFGVAYRRGLLRPAATVPAALAMLAGNVALVAFGPYSLSLVGIEGQRLTNMAPPSLLLAGHAIMMCCLIIAAIPAIERWAQRPRVWWLTAIGNSGAMTLYLWHMPALLGIHLLFDTTGHPRYPGQPDFLAISIAQLLLMVALVAMLFLALRPLENNPLPGWDGPITVTGARSVAVGILLCIAGVATLASVKWGLKDDGLYCMAVMLAALVAARTMSGFGPSPPVGGSSSTATLPERIVG